MSDQENFSLDSQEDLSKRPKFPAMQAEDYIVRVAKVIPELTQRWSNNKPVPGMYEFNYRIIVTPIRSKSGDPMLDTDGNIVEPLRKILSRGINPKSKGFMPDKVTPSALRAFVAHMEGTDVKDRITCKDFVVIGPKGEFLADADHKAQVLAEEMGKKEKDLTNLGYSAVPDLRVYEGQYIGISVEVNGEGYNKITRFTKLPNSFVKPGEEAIAEFNVNVLAKFLEKSPAKTEAFWAEKYGTPSYAGSKVPSSSFSTENAGEVEMPDVEVAL